VQQRYTIVSHPPSGRCSRAPRVRRGTPPGFSPRRTRPSFSHQKLPLSLRCENGWPGRPPNHWNNGVPVRGVLVRYRAAIEFLLNLLALPSEDLSPHPCTFYRSHRGGDSIGKQPGGCDSSRDPRWQRRSSARRLRSLCRQHGPRRSSRQAGKLLRRQPVTLTTSGRPHFGAKTEPCTISVHSTSIISMRLMAHITLTIRVE